MLNFTFYNPTKIIFGVGEIDKVGIEARKIGQAAMIITGKRSSSAFGIINRVTDYLEREGIGALVFDKIEPNPRCTTIDAAAELARKNKCDMVIGVGGGSPMDAAKGVAVAAVNDGPIWEYVYHGQPIPKKINRALPIIEIPTLAATGSEANSGAVISNWETHEKAVLGHPLLFPKFTIIDPELTMTVPKDYTIDGGVDIICHVIESYFTGVEESPIQNRFSLAIIRTVMDYLPLAVKNPKDINARTQLSWASAVALAGMVNSGRGGSFPLHAMEHALSAHYDISHGRGLALLLPRLMEYTYKARPEPYVLLAREAFGAPTEGKSETEIARMSIDAMRDWLGSVERDITMSDVGIKDDSRFEQMAEDTIRIYGRGQGYLDNPKRLHKEDIVNIFKMAM